MMEKLVENHDGGITLRKKKKNTEEFCNSMKEEEKESERKHE
jgi:hypothetical protein